MTYPDYGEICDYVTLTVFAAVAELERGYILDCQCDGIAIAKSNGKYRGKSKKQICAKLWDELYVKWRKGEITAVEFMKKMRCRKSVFFRYKKERITCESQITPMIPDNWGIIEIITFHKSLFVQNYRSEINL